MDLVREILLAIEERENAFEPFRPQIEGYEEAEIAYHIEIMAEADLIHAKGMSRLGGNPTVWMIERMTWDGHEFLDAARDEGRWEKTKSIINQAGGLTWPMIMQVLGHYMNVQIDQWLGSGP